MDNGHEDQEENKNQSSTGLDENIAALLCYLGTFVTGIVFFILEKKSSFIKFHAMQSTVVFLILWIAGIVVGYVPFFGWILSTLISFLGFILWIVLMVKVYQKENIKLPIVGNIAENLMGKFSEEK